MTDREKAELLDFLLSRLMFPPTKMPTEKELQQAAEALQIEMRSEEKKEIQISR